MRKKLNGLITGEAFKMRDVAFVPSIAVAGTVPKLLILIVAAIAIYAVVKIIKISKNKKDKDR